MRDSWRRLRQRPRGWGFYLATTTAVVVVMATALFVALKTLPLNFDAHTYRLPRLVFWLQEGAIRHVETMNARINLMPYNGALLLAWVVAFHRDWTLLNTVQWVAAVGTLLATYRLARTCGLRRSWAMLGVLLVCGYPVFIAEAVSVQSDMTPAFLVTTFVYAMVRGTLDRRRSWLAVSGIALGLAVGTKMTVILAGPGLVLVAGVTWWTSGAWRRLKLVGWWAACVLAGTAVFGSMSYVNNYRTYGHPFGPRDVLGMHSVAAPSLANTVKNMKLHLYTSLSPTPAPAWAHDALRQIRDLAFLNGETPAILDRAHSYAFNQLMNAPQILNHDVVWFGTIMTAVFLLVLLLWRPQWKNAAAVRVYSMLWAAAVLFIVVSALLTYMVFSGRFMLTVAPLGTIAIVYGMWRIRLVWLRACVAGCLAVVSAGWAYYGLAYNAFQPLWGEPDTTLAHYGAIVPTEPGDTVGLTTGADSPVAAYMFPQDDRRFVAIMPGEYDHHSVIELFEKYALTTLIVETDGLSSSLPLPWLVPGLHSWIERAPYKRAPRHVFSVRAPARPLEKIPTSLEPNFDSVWAFEPLWPAEFVDGNPLIEIHETLRARVDLSDAVETAWPVEFLKDDGAFLWLGHGPAEGLGFHLTCLGQRNVRLVMEMSPGHGRTDTRRNLVLTCDGREVWRGELDAAGELAATVGLPAGGHALRLFCTDEATVTRHPNGDTRNLLIGLHGIKIAPRAREGAVTPHSTRTAPSRARL